MRRSRPHAPLDTPPARRYPDDDMSAPNAQPAIPRSVVRPVAALAVLAGLVTIGPMACEKGTSPGPDRSRQAPATASGPAVSRQTDLVRTQVTQLRVRQVRAALERYRRDVGHYPTAAEGGLEALAAMPAFGDPALMQRWQGPYRNADDLRDGWGRPLRYDPATHTVGALPATTTPPTTAPA